MGGDWEHLPCFILCLTTGSVVPADVLVRGILSSSFVPPPRTPHGTAQPADPLHFPPRRTYDMMGSLASGSGGEPLPGGGGGSTPVVQNLYSKLVERMIKMGPKNAELEDGEPGGLDREKL